jgi:hypothetical protein
MGRLRHGVLTPLLAVVIVAALAGCAPPHHDGSSSHSPSSHASGHSATPTPAATRPQLVDLVLSTKGLGPLHLGAPVPSTPAPLAIVAWDPAMCVSSETGIVAGAPNAGAWATTFPDAVGPISEDRQAPFILTTVGATRTGNVNLVWVWTVGIHTASGINVGSTLAEVNTAYPTFSRTIHGVLSDVYVMDAGTGSLSFEVSKQDSDDSGNYWPDDQVGKVLWMGATLPGAAIGPIAASDVGPSTCPSAA